MHIYIFRYDLYTENSYLFYILKGFKFFNSIKFQYKILFLKK